jgi:hypothetical protein
LEVSIPPAAAEPLAVVALPVVEPEAEADVPLAEVEAAGALVLAAPVVAAAFVGAVVAAALVVGAVVAVVPDAGAVVPDGFGVSVALLPPHAARMAAAALPAIPPSIIRRLSRLPNSRSLTSSTPS